jgi:hypothetical protein
VAHFFAIPLLAAPTTPFGIDHAVTRTAAALIFFFHVKSFIFCKPASQVFLAKIARCQNNQIPSILSRQLSRQS